MNERLSPQAEERAVPEKLQFRCCRYGKAGLLFIGLMQAYSVHSVESALKLVRGSIFIFKLLSTSRTEVIRRHWTSNSFYSIIAWLK